MEHWVIRYWKNTHRRASRLGREALRVARENAGRALRSYSVASRILAGLPGTPVLTIRTASRICGVSRTAASRGLETLRSAGALSTESIGAGRRACTACSVLDTITWAERRLASTRFSTRVCAPLGPAPARPGRRRSCGGSAELGVVQVPVGQDQADGHRVGVARVGSAMPFRQPEPGGNAGRGAVVR